MHKTLTKDKIHEDRGKRNLKLERVYRELYDVDRFLACYGRLYPNDGAMTPGTTEETVDGMKEEKIKQIIQSLKDGSFEWTPAKRVYIPKKNGKNRPLGLPTWTDKLVQDVIRSLLEPYYEAKFHNSSHGFRPNRGCHTALQACKKQFIGAVWFIEGDIKGCFDNINHEKLINILEESIDDTRFIRLIKDMLEAGYLEEWQYHATHSGTPQGGVISPLLANIYMHKLDEYVENTLKTIYNKGKVRKRNAKYNSIVHAMKKAKRRDDMETWKMLQQEQRQTPYGMQDDPDYRRLSYVRYADDFILSFIGPKDEAKDIKDNLKQFLKETLMLEMSDEKTLITHAKTEKARFLGYDIKVIQDNGQISTGSNALGKHNKRAINGKIRLEMPTEKVREITKRFMENGEIVHSKRELSNDDFSIVTYYGAVYRGVANYYCMAHDRAKKMTQVQYVMETSMLKTLANKHQTSVAQEAKRHKVWLETPQGKRKAFQVQIQRPGKKPLIATFGGFSLAREDKPINDKIIQWWKSSRTEILDRMLANQCEYCGKETKCEVHHIKKLSELLKKENLAGWKKMMAMRKRKTLVLCPECHDKLHAGKLD